MEKFLSRKFLNSLVGEIVGIVTLFWGIQTGEMVQVIAGAVITIAVVLGYVCVEGSIDKKGIEKLE